MKVTILGAGNLGSVLAILLANKGYEVVLWTIEKEVFHSIVFSRENPKYLANAKFPPEVKPTLDLQEALDGVNVLICAVPSSAVREVIAKARPFLKGNPLIVNFAKGLDPDTGMRLSQVIREELGGCDHRLVVVSGPSIAREILEGVPTAVAASASDLSYASEAKRLLETSFFKLYPTDDIVGVEVAGAFKNVFAIAAGMCDGIGLGFNTKSLVVSKGFEELLVLAEALGGRRETLCGISGLGDLIVTSFSPLSRNRRFGEKLAQGLSPQKAQEAIGQVVEGVRATQVARREAERLGLRLPIVEALYETLYCGLPAKEAIHRFLE